ncbi:hypothetical protein D3C85_927540 [compost metagenome]
MGDVVEEGMTRANRIGGADRRAGVAFHQAVGRDDLGEAIGATLEATVFVRGQQRQVGDIRIAQVDAKLFSRLLLDIRPGGQATAGAIEHASGRHGNQQRLAISIELELPVGIELWHHFVFPQEHLVGSVRGIGLVLIDERRGLVDVFANVVLGTEYTVGAWLVGGAGEHHEVGVGVGVVKRIVRFQRDIDSAAATLVDQVQSMVEELAEDGHPRVVGRGNPFIRRYVGNEQQVRRFWIAIVIEGETALGGIRCRHGSRVGRRLIGDQVADGAWCRIHHIAAGLLIGGLGRAAGKSGRGARPIDPVFGIAKLLVQHSRHGLIRRTIVLASGDQIVPRSVHGTQTDRQQRIAHQIVKGFTGSMTFCDDDLIENEGQILLDESDHCAFLGAKRPVDHSLARRMARLSGFNGFSGRRRPRTAKRTARCLRDWKGGRIYPADVPGGGP